jgi:glycosyltransferase involved in cell wall biosynthesis
MRLSICTPTIDSSAAYIDEAIRSVRAPPGVEIEHIIVHDGSEAFVQGLAAKYPHLQILRGPGRGPTPAIAAGIAAATGDFLFCLNSDDRLTGQALDALHRAATGQPGVEIWTGGTRIFRMTGDDEEETVRMLASPRATSASLANAMDDLPLLTARFIRRSVYARVGNMDFRFPESSDREFLIRVCVAGVREASLGVTVSELRQHQGSHTMSRQRGIVWPYLAEHVKIADAWLMRPDLPRSTARLFRSWRAREVLRMVYYQVRSQQWSEAWQSIGDALTADPLWALRAGSALRAWLRRRRS